MVCYENQLIIIEKSELITYSESETKSLSYIITGRATGGQCLHRQHWSYDIFWWDDKSCVTLNDIEEFSSNYYITRRKMTQSLVPLDYYLFILFRCIFWVINTNRVTSGESSNRMLSRHTPGHLTNGLTLVIYII